MTDKHNEAEEMQDAYARQQREGGSNGAGGAGSTNTPGNAPAGPETSGEDGPGPTTDLDDTTSAGR